MAKIVCTHRLRGREGRSAFEFDCQVAGVEATICWRDRDQAWLPTNWLGQSIPAAQIAMAAGVDEAQTAAELADAAALCEREYLRRDPPHLRAVA